jgi:hypothetical protein
MRHRIPGHPGRPDRPDLSGEGVAQPTAPPAGAALRLLSGTGLQWRCAAHPMAARPGAFNGPI